MIKTDPDSKNQTVFFILFIVTLVAFVITVSDFKNIVENQKHPIIEIAKNINSLSNVEYIGQNFALSIRKWVMAGGFVITMFIIYILMSKLDMNLNKIKWLRSKYMSVTHTAWMEVASTTFLLTVMAFMICTVLFSVIFTIWPVLSVNPGG